MLKEKIFIKVGGIEMFRQLLSKWSWFDKSDVGARAATFGHSRARLVRSAALVLAGLAMATVATAPARAADAIRFGGATMFFPQGSALIGVVAPEVFQKYGIELDPTDFHGSATNAVAAGLAGQTDVTSNGASFMVDAISQGGDFQLIFATARPLTDLYLSTDVVKRLGVPVNAPIADRLKALKGLTIASTGGTSSSHWDNLAALLPSAGMTPDDITVRSMSDPTSMMAAIRHGQIDGALYSTGNLAGLLTDGTGVRWISISRDDAPQLFEVPYTGIFASSKWIAANPDVVKRFRQALIESLALMKNDKATYSKLIKAKYAPDMDQGLWDTIYDQVLPSFYDDGKVTRAGWNTLLAQRKEVTGGDYSKAGYDTAVADVAKAD